MKKITLSATVLFSFLFIFSFSTKKNEIQQCDELTVTNNSLEKQNVRIKNKRGEIVSAFSLEPKRSQTITMASTIEERMALATSGEKFRVYAEGSRGEKEISYWNCDVEILGY